MRAGSFFLAAAAAAALAACTSTPDPKDMSVQPREGDGDGGQVVRLTGAGFLGHGPVVVHVGLRSARAVVIEDDAHLRFTTPEAEAFGPTDLRVEFSDGTVHELPGAYTYVQVDGKPLKPIPFRPGDVPVPTAAE